MSFDPSDVYADGCADISGTKEAGSEVTTGSIIKNDNDTAATGVAHLLENGTSIASTSLTVPANGRNTGDVIFDVTVPSEPGDYTYSIEVRSVSKA